MADRTSDESIVRELLIVLADTLVPVRLGDPVRRDQVERLLRVLDDFAQRWADKRDVPKSVALALLDAKAFLFLTANSTYRTEEDRQELGRAASDISNAITRALASGDKK